MNIKKIIREEVDDFNWIKDISGDPFIQYFDEGNHFLRIYPKDMGELTNIQNNLHKLGYEYHSSASPYRVTRDIQKGKVYFLVFKTYSDGEKGYTIESDSETPNDFSVETTIDNPFIRI